MITPKLIGLYSFRGEAIINWVRVRGFESPMASLLYVFRGSHKTKAVTRIYIWGCLATTQRGPNG